MTSTETVEHAAKTRTITREAYLAAFTTWFGAIRANDAFEKVVASEPEWNAWVAGLTLPATGTPHDFCKILDAGYKTAPEAVRKLYYTIHKSNLLARLVYDGEPLRTLQCPVHKGSWTGTAMLSGCIFGCGGTGWLHSESQKQHAVMDYLTKRADAALAFGRVDRATYHPDGVTRESDTDHTVMLGLIAADLAHHLYPNMAPLYGSEPTDLDPNRIMAFAMVHDLTEIETGDTNTLGQTPADAAAKRQSDWAAVHHTGRRIGYGWSYDLLNEYTKQKAPEARFVRLVDKILPKITHMLNGGVAFEDKWPNMQPGEVMANVKAAHEAQSRALRAEYPEYERVLDVLDIAMDRALAAYALGAFTRAQHDAE